MIVLMSEFMFMITFQGLLLLPGDNNLECYLQYKDYYTSVHNKNTFYT